LKESQKIEKNKVQKLNSKELMKKHQILSQQYKALTKELEDCKQRNKYLLIDFDKYKNHINKQLNIAKEYANESLLKDILSIVDDLERAIVVIKDKTDLEGITRIYNNLIKLLAKYKVKKIDCLGKQLDPKYHEALLREDSEKEDGTILEELQFGYTYKDKVLRYSKVKVAKHVDKE